MKTLTIYKVYVVQLVALLAVVVLCGCAKQSMPSGGPRDITPPAVRQYQPENGTLNFDSKTIYIEFDEYVVIKDADNNILVSPPLANKPHYSTKGKGIVVKLNDTLQPNTTYLFQFKNAIADFNEGNLLPSMEYVFSTGTTIDSMTLKGRVVDALTQRARSETVTVVLFDATEADSSMVFPATDSGLTAKAIYVTRCDTNGNFSFNHIRQGVYYVAAMEDNNKNMSIDIGEPSGFANGQHISYPLSDSTMHDSTTTTPAKHNGVMILLSDQTNEIQRITSNTIIRQGAVRIISLKPMVDPRIESGDEQVIWTINPQRDTIMLWSLREKIDTLRLTLTDSSGIADTMIFRWNSQLTNLLKKKGFAKPNYSESLPYYDTLWLKMDVPLDMKRSRLDSVATIMDLSDSTVTYCDLIADSMGLQVRVDYDFHQGTGYALTINKGHLYNFYGHENETITAKFNVTKAEDYGNLSITLIADSTTDCQLIVELLGDKDKVVDRCIVSEAGQITFKHLKPAKYRLRVIFDTNGNGKWDGGDCRQLLQPERVLYFKKTLDVRANWDFEEQMQI